MLYCPTPPKTNCDKENMYTCINFKPPKVDDSLSKSGNNYVKNLKLYFLMIYYQ